MFSHLITFHDPELSNHLEGIGFIPDVRLIICFVTIILLHALQSIIIIWHIVLFHVSSVNKSLYHKQYSVSSCKFLIVIVFYSYFQLYAIPWFLTMFARMYHTKKQIMIIKIRIVISMFMNCQYMYWYTQLKIEFAHSRKISLYYFYTTVYYENIHF